MINLLLAIAGHQTRHHNGDVEDPHDTFKCGDHPDIRIDRRNSPVSHAAHRDHAEIQKRADLIRRDRLIEGLVDELAKEYAGKLKVRKLNTDENPEVAGRYQVMSIPTILFFKNGQPVEKLVGARPKRQFKEMIDSLLAQHAETA